MPRADPEEPKTFGEHLKPPGPISQRSDPATSLAIPSLDRQPEPGYLPTATRHRFRRPLRSQGGIMPEKVLSSFCMRATITVDGELAERIERLSQEKATSFEDLANAALREGLEHLAGGPRRAGGETEKSSGRISYTHPVSLGGCLLESLDDVAGVLAAAEGEAFK